LLHKGRSKGFTVFHESDFAVPVSDNSVTFSPEKFAAAEVYPVTFYCSGIAAVVSFN
jgi:hypothetical protein